ncbi:hypothetical protein MKW94_011778 [Papaver nudicaule]|uniref:RING-type E3 ubiquitin transferase n=1 Tax=Papaver nudicaule TaxID=74823 RepID=A0AA41W368_PAPNU|nr:hypothetical protein [Papaver nudicaule]
MSYCRQYQHPPQHQQHRRIGNQQYPIHATAPRQNAAASRFPVFLDGGIILDDVPASRVRVSPNSSSTPPQFVQFHDLLLPNLEEIGSVRTRLSEEEISTCMKTRVHHKSAISANLEKEENCSICHSDYEKLEKIGTLYCGHEYHVQCIKRWLLINKTCPICRRPALP